jgi:hypothetical protein
VSRLKWIGYHEPAHVMDLKIAAAFAKCSAAEGCRTIATTCGFFVRFQNAELPRAVVFSRFHVNRVRSYTNVVSRLRSEQTSTPLSSFRPQRNGARVSLSLSQGVLRT